MTKRSKLTLLLQRLSRKKIPSRLSLVCLFLLPLTSFIKDTCKLDVTLSSAQLCPTKRHHNSISYLHVEYRASIAKK